MDTDDAPTPLDDLARRAGGTRIAVVGAGIAGLVAAREFARLGFEVVVWEAADRVGGTVRTVHVDDLDVDTGATGIAGRGEAAQNLIAELGLADQARDVVLPRRWVAGLPGPVHAAPLPAETVLGIPENMWDPAAQAVLGTGGTWRAYMDRLRPPLTIGHETRLGTLVRQRMGAKVRDRLVAPVTVGALGVDPDEIDVSVAAPGLNAALTSTGSLSGAVAAVREKRPPMARRSVVGGLSRLTEALADDLRVRGVDLRCGIAVSGLESAGPDTGDGWVVHTGDDEFDASDDAPAPEVFDAVLVAVPETEARRLLSSLVGPIDAPTAPAPHIETVSLVVDLPALDDAPRGTQVVCVPGSHAATGLMQVTASVPWLGEQAGPGRHVVRVSFGGLRAEPATAGLDDAEATALARAEASALLGTDIPQDAVRAAVRERFIAAPPRARAGLVAQAVQVREAVESITGLAVTGAWLSGAGIAQVVPDAVAAAERLRRRLLFPTSSPAEQA